MTNKKTKIKFKDYFLMFLLMGVSGNPVFTRTSQFTYLLIVLLELLIYVNCISKEAWRKTFIWTGLFVVIFIGQLITLKKIGYLACVNYIFKVASAIFAAYIFKEKFALTYLKTMSFLSIIALFCWGLNILGVRLPAVVHFDNNIESILFYTQQSVGHSRSNLGVLRNSGMFWEPGAYAGYLLIAFFLYINRLDYLWVRYRQSCIILISALITTFSTTGYIIFAVIVLFFLNDRVKNRVIFMVVSIAAVIGAFYMFNRLSFMGDKIQGEYERAIVMDQYDVNFSRMGALMFDMQYIKIHPFFGNGLLNETRFSQHIAFADNLSGFGNGFSGEIAYFGIPFMLVFLIATYRNPSLKQKWRLLLLIVLLLQGEYFMNYPMYFIFPFVKFFNEDANLCEAPIIAKQNG